MLQALAGKVHPRARSAFLRRVRTAMVDYLMQIASAATAAVFIPLGVMTTIACKYCRSLGAAVAVLIGQLWTAQVQAADYDVGPIHIAQPWARATPKGAKSGAGYMTITNNGSTPDRLSCVSSDASAKCQIHSMTMENGVMKMRPAESKGSRSSRARRSCLSRRAST